VAGKKSVAYRGGVSKREPMMREVPSWIPQLGVLWWDSCNIPPDEGPMCVREGRLGEAYRQRVFQPSNPMRVAGRELRKAEMAPPPSV